MQANLGCDAKVVAIAQASDHSSPPPLRHHEGHIIYTAIHCRHHHHHYHFLVPPCLLSFLALSAFVSSQAVGLFGDTIGSNNAIFIVESPLSAALPGQDPLLCQQAHGSTDAAKQALAAYPCQIVVGQSMWLPERSSIIESGRLALFSPPSGCSPKPSCMSISNWVKLIEAE